jgi:hypothetical protein
MEEGKVEPVLEKQETSSGGSGSTDVKENNLNRDGGTPDGGLGGPMMGPPRRATMMTDPAEGRTLGR